MTIISKDIEEISLEEGKYLTNITKKVINEKVSIVVNISNPVEKTTLGKIGRKKKIGEIKVEIEFSTSNGKEKISKRGTPGDRLEYSIEEDAKNLKLNIYD